MAITLAESTENKGAANTVPSLAGKNQTKTELLALALAVPVIPALSTKRLLCARLVVDVAGTNMWPMC